MSVLEKEAAVRELREDLRRMQPPFLLRKYEAVPDDYELLVDEDLRCEYLDGVLVVHSPATLDHEDLGEFLGFLLRGFISHRNVGRSFGAHAVMQLDERRFCPDLSFLKASHSGRISSGRVMGPMDLAIEILSKSTRDYDLREKRAAYREGGVPEIWFIDPERREFHVDWVEPEGAASGNPGANASSPANPAYRTELLREGRWSSRVLPGFWIDVSWMWSDPLPNAIECLNRIIH